MQVSRAQRQAFCATQALSPIGRCRTFDAAGDGYGRGEGFAVAVLRPLQPANPGHGRGARLPPGDMPCGIILGSAVNQDGRSSGLTAPNGPSQSALVRAVLAVAGATQDAVGAISVHGTGAGPPSFSNGMPSGPARLQRVPRISTASDFRICKAKRIHFLQPAFHVKAPTYDVSEL